MRRKTYKKTEYYLAIAAVLFIGISGILIPHVSEFASGILLGYLLGCFSPVLLIPFKRYLHS